MPSTLWASRPPSHEVPAGPDRRDITHAHLSYEHRAGHPADHGTDYGSDEAHDL